MGCGSSKHLKHQQAHTNEWASPPTSITTKQRTPKHECSLKYYQQHFMAVASTSHSHLNTDNPRRIESPCSIMPSLNDKYDKLMRLEMGDSPSISSVGASKKAISKVCHTSLAQSWSMGLTAEPACLEASPPETIDVQDIMYGLEDGCPSSSVCTKAAEEQKKSGIQSMSFLTVEKTDAWRCTYASPASSHVMKLLAEEEGTYTNENEKPWGSENGYGLLLVTPNKSTVPRSPLTGINFLPRSSKSHAPGDNQTHFMQSAVKDRLICKREYVENKLTVSQDDSIMHPSMKYLPSSSVKLTLIKEEHNKYSRIMHPSMKYSPDGSMKLDLDKEQENRHPKITPLSIPARTLSRRAVVNQPESPLFDPDLVASYEKALESLSKEDWNRSYDNATLLRTAQSNKSASSTPLSETVPTKLEGNLYDPFRAFQKNCPPGGENKLVLYSTTLRGIKKTFDECNHVREILQIFGLRIDERDVSMHLEFLNELRQLMGGVVQVPRMFIRGRYIGGLKEVSNLHESGRLGELVEGLPKEINGGNCDGCGGVRFVPCLKCNGSCKLINKDNIFLRCPECNENGLIQCPICR